MGEQEDNAAYVLKTPLPDRFDWYGTYKYGEKKGQKKPEPEWFQDWVRKKALYVVRIARATGRLPTMIMYWKVEKIYRVFPESMLEELEELKLQQGMEMFDE